MLHLVKQGTMDGFEDDFSPLQSSALPSSITMDQSQCPTENIPNSVDLLDDNGEDVKDGDDVPALRCKVTLGLKCIILVKINIYIYSWLGMCEITILYQLNI